VILCEVTVLVSNVLTTVYLSVVMGHKHGGTVEAWDIGLGTHDLDT
jgi:hypothetical protein